MKMKKKTPTLTASLLLAPALALGALPAEAQKKSSAPASRKALTEALRQSRPQEAIRQAERLIKQAHQTHDFPLLLEAEKVRWEQQAELDPTKSDLSYTRLQELGQLPWLRATDRAALRLFLLRHYAEGVYLHYLSSSERAEYDSILPTGWGRQQFHDFYAKQVDALLGDLPTLTQALQPYEAVFTLDRQDLAPGRTLASELLYQLAYPAPPAFPDLQAKALRVLQTLEAKQLTPYTNCFIDQQGVIQRLDSLDRCAQPDAIEAEVDGFLQRWGKTPLINNYNYWLLQTVPSSGLRRALQLERILALATGLTKQHRQELQSTIQAARQATCSFDAPDRLVATRDFTLRIPSAYLVDEVKLSLYPAPASYNPTQRNWKVAEGATPLWTKRLALPLDSLGLLSEEQALSLSLPEAGAYELRLEYQQTPEARGKLEPATYQIYASDYLALNHQAPDKHVFQWFEARSGKPLSGASFQSYLQPDWDRPAQKQGIVRADSWGRFTSTSKLRYHLASGRDPLLVDGYENHRGFSSWETEQASSQLLQGFITADRPAYRPGQTARFYGIVSRVYHQAERAEVAAGTRLSVQIRDARWQTVHETEVTTDAWGRFTLDYPLPSEGLTGRYHIEVTPQTAPSEGATKRQRYQRSSETFSTYFQVFEYKRIDSQLTLDTPKLPLQAGSQVTITGTLRTLSGSPIAGAQVSHNLKAQRYTWRFFGADHQGQDSKIFPGEQTITTDAEGRFSLTLTLPELTPKEEEIFQGRRITFPWYRYELTVKTIDATGQEHEERLNLPAGREVARITPRLVDFIDKQAEQTSLAFEKPYGEEDIQQEIHYTIQQDGRTLLSDSLMMGKDADLTAQLKKLPAGRYELHYRSVFSDSLQYAGQKAFYLFDSKQPTTLSDLRAPLLLSGSNGLYSASQRPVVYWATGLQDAYVFYEAFSEHGLIAEGMLRPEAGKIHSLPFDLSKQKETPEEIHVRLWTVRDGRFFDQYTTLRRIQPKKELVLHWQSFRDRLKAGQEETWHLTLRTPDGRPARETTVATWMYDSALDAFGRLAPWRPALRLQDVPYRYSGQYFRTLSHSWQAVAPSPSWYKRSLSDQAHGDFRGRAVPPSSLLARWLEEQPARPTTYDAPMALAVASAEGFSFGRDEEHVLRSVVTRHTRAYSGAKILGKQATPEPEAPPKLRTSFAENAFFLPKLTTDAKGEVSWSFTAPERLSRWRLYVLAHSQRMDHQTEVKTIETYRPFSIRPALPRFLSEGDSLRLVTEVRNDSDKAQRGELTLELFDPQSEAVLHRATAPFDVPRGQSQSYSLPVAGFAGRDSVGARIWARGAEASDGEQHLLAVRSARKPITERLVFTRHVAGRDSLSLASLLPQGDRAEALQTGQLSLQVSSQAAFFTLSALQGLSTSQDASAFARATSLYAQTLVLALRDVDGLKTWAKRLTAEASSSDSTARRSALQQTPWAGVSDQEKQDELALARQLLAPVAGLESDRLLRQLEGLQDAQGLWSWYPGMKGSVYTTEAVLRILLRLPAGRLEQAHRLRLGQLVKAGLTALEKDFIELHQRLTTKKEVWGNPLQRGMDFLSLSAEAQHLGFFTPSEQAKGATSYFLSRLKKEALRLPLWQKPDAARILLSQGDRKLASSLALSLREHLVTDETGSFFASLDASPYSWMDKTLRTVVGTLQLLRLLGQGDRPEVEGMTRWVINQKRTSAWANELVSADAIHALLLGEVTSLAEGFAEVKLEVPLADGKTLTASGHSLTESLPLSQLPATAPTMVVSQAGRGIVWGSAVATYTVPTETVTEASGRELRLRHETFLLREEGGKEVLLPLSSGQQLRVGDRLRTLITIELDRSMDFLRLEDPRTGFTEPISQLPGYAWGEGTGYYYEPKDQKTIFYLDHLTRGTYRLHYDQQVARAGVFRGSVTEIVSCYAPEFGAHTAVAPTLSVLPLPGK